MKRGRRSGSLFFFADRDLRLLIGRGRYQMEQALVRTIF